jgi:peroxiredoxin Q/BCP
VIDPGKRAPAFTLADQNGEKHALQNCAGRPVVLYFYPKDSTPGCTKEACAFEELLPRFGEVDACVFGVSPDDVASHAKFAAKYDLSFPLLADTKRDAEGRPTVCAKYGVWQEKSLYGRTFLGVVRTTYLIGRDGKVARRWDRVKVKGHAEAVLEALGELD